MLILFIIFDNVSIIWLVPHFIPWAQLNGAGLRDILYQPKGKFEKKVRELLEPAQYCAFISVLTLTQCIIITSAQVACFPSDCLCPRTEHLLFYSNPLALAFPMNLRNKQDMQTEIFPWAVGNMPQDEGQQNRG